MNKEIDLYENEKLIDNKISCTYLAVHDDMFYRTVDYEKIQEYINEYGELFDIHYEVSALSENEFGYNVLMINVIMDKTIFKEIKKKSENDMQKLTTNFNMLNWLEDIMYYSVTPCAFNPIGSDKN